MSFFACWYITSLWEHAVFSAQVSSFSCWMKPESWAEKTRCSCRLLYYNSKFNLLCSSLTLDSSWSYESLFYTLWGVFSIQSVTLNIQLFWRGYLHGNKIAWWTIRDPIFHFFIVDVLALILFLIVFRRDLCTCACQSLCQDVMHDTHADVHGYLILQHTVSVINFMTMFLAKTTEKHPSNLGLKWLFLSLIFFQDSAYPYLQRVETMSKFHPL